MCKTDLITQYHCEICDELVYHDAIRARGAQFPYCEACTNDVGLEITSSRIDDTINVYLETLNSRLPAKSDTVFEGDQVALLGAIFELQRLCKRYDPVRFTPDYAYQAIDALNAMWPYIRKVSQIRKLIADKTLEQADLIRGRLLCDLLDLSANLDISQLDSMTDREDFTKLKRVTLSTNYMSHLIDRTVSLLDKADYKIHRILFLIEEISERLNMLEDRMVRISIENYHCPWLSLTTSLNTCRDRLLDTLATVMVNKHRDEGIECCVCLPAETIIRFRHSVSLLDSSINIRITGAKK
jgi:hypothetical protein